MPTRIDTAEIYNELRQAIIADADIVAAMSGGTIDIKEGIPEDHDLPAPFMTWKIAEDEDRIPGLAFKGDIEIFVFGHLVDNVRQIAGIILDKFQIPDRLPAGIASTNFRLTQFLKTASGTFPGRVETRPGGAKLIAHFLRFDCRIRREPPAT